MNGPGPTRGGRRLTSLAKFAAAAFRTARLLDETLRSLEERKEMEDFIFAFDSNLQPIVGQQVTLAGDAPPAALARLDLLLARARAGACDVVLHFSQSSGAQRGALYSPENDSFLRDDERSVSLATLRAGQRPITLTAVPPGEGRRSGIDRDLDGVLDGLPR